MQSSKLTALLLILPLALPALASARESAGERLPPALLDVRAPSARISGSPGAMQIQDRSCRSLPLSGSRARIVDTAVQEWAYFGFTLLDYTRVQDGNNERSGGRRRWTLLDQAQAARVASSIAGYWAAAPDSGWILQRQNERWNAQGDGIRWRDPWSAAFISWVMCESGLGDQTRFARAIAHHTYIDQAIRARDSHDDTAAYIAYEVGEQPVLPGDLLCRGSRPAYRTLDERRSHLGVGARTHCDIVVKVDPQKPAYYVIGGNVRGTVAMKLLPATATEMGFIKPIPYGQRQLFAHLKLNASPLPLDALDQTPTMQALNCVSPSASTLAAAATPQIPTGGTASC